MAIRIGVIGTADIAKRRMIPAIKKSTNFEYAGVAIASSEEWDEPHTEEEYKDIYKRKQEKAKGFVDLFDGLVYESYEALLKDETVNAVYIPLPPALHFKWAMKALLSGKHVLLEKPAGISLDEVEKLIKQADDLNLCILENYGFVYHNQFSVMKKMINDGKVGELRLIRGSFGFPHREATDFRYSKKYGGGALLDCGGYTIKAASMFMNNPKVISSLLNVTDNHEVDVYGSVTLRDDDNLEAQLAFGMDNSYKCDFEIWGSKGALISKRAYTAPDNFNSELELTTREGVEKINCGTDDQFLKILNTFYECMKYTHKRISKSEQLLKQIQLIQNICEGYLYG